MNGHRGFPGSFDRLPQTNPTPAETNCCQGSRWYLLINIHKALQCPDQGEQLYHHLFNMHEPFRVHLY